MVHKKYIKRGDKVFGPYLYQNYRENGITKTRYLGKSKPGVNKNLFIFGVVVLLVLLFSIILFSFGKNLYIESKESLEGELISRNLGILNFIFSIKGILGGELAEQNLNVFVQIIRNDPPEIRDVPPKIFVCENTALNYDFFVRDVNGDSLNFYFEQFLGVRFYFYPPSTLEGNTLIQKINFFTNPLDKLDKRDVRRERAPSGYGELIKGWAIYPETIYVTDGFPPPTSAQTDIIIIEVNNAPEFDIRVQTILTDNKLYTVGDDSVFYYDLGAELRSRLEETPTDYLIFNLTYSNGSVAPFSINDEGIINITGNESFINAGEMSKVYDLNVSVIDDGFGLGTGHEIEAHVNISTVCGPFEYDDSPKSWSDYFSLTITRKNRAPQRTSYYPENLSLEVGGDEPLYFNLTARDPDLTPLDVYWYVDGVEKDDFEGLKEGNVSEFEHIFGYGVSGLHKIKAVVNDSLLSDFVEWNISVELVARPQPGVGGGGGGGGGGMSCRPKWGCEEWEMCENLKENLESVYEAEKVDKKHELLIKKRCEIFNYTESICGFQTRKCTDFNKCGTDFKKPGIIRECYYTSDPNCEDGIKNCHHGYCEVLVDCGGWCDACPTCSDGIKNQGEAEIDCGGPCKACVERPFGPLLFKSIVSYSLIALLILILVLILRQLKKYKVFKRVVRRVPKSKLSKPEKVPEKKPGFFRGRFGKNIEKKNVVVSLFFVFFVIALLFASNVFIMNLASERGIVGVEDFDLLASYGLINSIFENFGMFFVTGPIVNENSKLLIWDDTDPSFNEERFTVCKEYVTNPNFCIRKGKGDPGLWAVNFYANYTDKNTGNPINEIEGDCDIRFQDSQVVYGLWYDMEFESDSGLWKNLTIFDYKGTYNFEIDCLYTGFNNLVEDDFIIINTVPYIITSPSNYIDFDLDFQGDTLECVEDMVCYYNFSANVSEDDSNDVLVFDYVDSSNTTLTGFNINETTGILEINITNSLFTGSGKKIELSVQDTESTLITALLKVDVQEVNDPPIFNNLDNQTLLSGDLFEYAITVSDEEWNIPFIFNVSFESCDAAGRGGDCILLTEGVDYSVDGQNGILDISLTPTDNDVGSYLINFSVMDNSSLGNQTTSQVVNFTVDYPVWNKSLVLDYLLTEDEEFYLNLSENVTDARGAVSFSNDSAFPSFNLTSDGIINFTPSDVDVGVWSVEIIADNGITISPKIFNFDVSNVNDGVLILPITSANGVIITGSNLEAKENLPVEIFLFIEDDDFLISQKSFYDENLTLNLTIKGSNESLFDFVLDNVAGNQAEYIGTFIARNVETIDYYNITINVTDKSGFSDVLKFNLTILDNNYDTPNITFPDEDYEFYLEEGNVSDLVFSANHTVGDELIYRFYINDSLRYPVQYYGDGRALIWPFTPDFTDETYGEKVNLTLVVLNPFFSDLNTSRTWNLTINHTNAPVEFFYDIGDKPRISLDYSLGVHLDNHFLDVDYYDAYYNQSIDFDIASTGSLINVLRDDSSDWIFVFSSTVPANETFNITAYDIDNETGARMTNAISNNFIVEFVPPTVVLVPTPSTGGNGGGNGGGRIVSLKILMPGQISAYEYDKIEIPLLLINSGKQTFNDLSLNSSAFKDGDIASEVRTSLDKDYFKSLGVGKQENLTLTVFFDTDKLGNYEVVVNVESKSPKYKDWGKVYINLQAINESQVREMLMFTEELIVGNAQCLELKEVVDEARNLFEAGDYSNAKMKTEQAVEACRESIAQVSLPRLRIKSFRTLLYLGLGILLAFIIGMIYYFLKRRSLGKSKTSEKIK